MSYRATNWAKGVTHGAGGEKLTCSEKAVLMCLADWHNLERNCAWPSMKSLAIAATITERRCRAVTRSLERKGVIAVQHIRGLDGRNQTNRYFLIGLPHLNAAPGPAAAETIKGEVDAANVVAADVRARVHAWLDAALEREPEGRGEVYRMAYTEVVPEAAQKYASVKGVGLASLLNEVVFHAARGLGIKLDESNARRLAAMHRDHDFTIIELLPEACQRANGDPLSYLLGMTKAVTE